MNNELKNLKTFFERLPFLIQQIGTLHAGNESERFFTYDTAFAYLTKADNNNTLAVGFHLKLGPPDTFTYIISTPASIYSCEVYELPAVIPEPTLTTEFSLA